VKLNQHEAAMLGAHDDDWYGLWELDWYFNSANPEWSRKERTAFVARLIEHGFVDVFSGPLMTERPPLSSEIALKTLANPDVWAPPADGQETGYYATTNPTGFAALKAFAQ
jgi:hypothetical protein